MITISCAKSQEMGEIKMLYVFDYFQIKGYTTAGAYTHFDDMIKQNVAKIEAEQEDCNQLNQILKGIKPKKHTQTKFGIENVFIEIKTEKCFIRAVIGIGSSSMVVTDLTNYKEYWIKDKEQQKWLTEFINKIKNAKKPD
jgi:prefoldin subunit 5